MSHRRPSLRGRAILLLAFVLFPFFDVGRATPARRLSPTPCNPVGPPGFGGFRPSGSYSRDIILNKIAFRPSPLKTDLACDWKQFESGEAKRRFEGVLSQAGGWPSDAVRVLQSLDKTKTQIVFIFEFKSSQIAFKNLVQNTFCGVRRLGLGDQVVILAMDVNAKKMAEGYGFTTIFSKGLSSLADRVGQSNGIPYGNRMLKLVTSLFFVDHGFDHLLSDIDTIWVESPIPYMQSFGSDVAGTHDYCWMDMNTGFLYYRANQRTRELLKAAMGFKKNPKHFTDNDQYLFNCAWPYFSAYHNLSVSFTDDRTQFTLLRSCQDPLLPKAKNPPLLMLH